jgi:hypothetical protein
MATASQVDDTHPSWYPLYLKELESKYPDVYQEVVSTVIGRNAERQTAESSTVHDPGQARRDPDDGWGGLLHLNA